jgi:hypothetical protein
MLHRSTDAREKIGLLSTVLLELLLQLVQPLSHAARAAADCSDSTV